MSSFSSLSRSYRHPCPHCGKSFEMSLSEMIMKGRPCPHCGESLGHSEELQAAMENPPSPRKRKIVFFLILVWLAAIVVVGVKVSWGAALSGGFFGAFFIAFVIQKILQVRDRIKAFRAGALKLTTTTRSLAMGDRLDGQAGFSTKKALQGCRIRVRLDLEVRVHVGDSTNDGGKHVWQTFASSQVDLPDTVFDMHAHETRTLPFSLDARIPDTRPSDKKSILGRMMQEDESKAWAMTPEELVSKYKTRWTLGAVVLGISEQITSSLSLPVAKGNASR